MDDTQRIKDAEISSLRTELSLTQAVKIAQAAEIERLREMNTQLFEQRQEALRRESRIRLKMQEHGNGR